MGMRIQIEPKGNIAWPPLTLQSLRELLGPLLVGGGRVLFDLAADRGGHLEITLHGTQARSVKGVPGLAHHDGFQVLEPLEDGLMGLAKTGHLTLQVIRRDANLALSGLKLQPTTKSLHGDSRDRDQDPDPGDGHGLGILSIYAMVTFPDARRTQPLRRLYAGARSGFCEGGAPECAPDV